MILLLALASFSAGTLAQQAAKPAAASADTAQAQQAVHLLGLEGIKRNVKGRLTVGANGLKFTSAATNNEITIASIEDVFTGQDTRQTGGTGLTVAKLAVPYGGGRVLSLFTHEKFDSLTVEYRDTNGGLHGAVFTMPVGQAVAAKKELIAAGAKVSTPVEETPATSEAVKKEKQ
jgi:hypothetical protein